MNLGIDKKSLDIIKKEIDSREAKIWNNRNISELSTEHLINIYNYILRELEDAEISEMDGAYAESLN